MSVLSRDSIRERLNLNVTHERSLIITPLLRTEQALDLDAVDLRLGCHFLLPKVPPAPAILPGASGNRSSHLHAHVPYGKYLVVPAHQTVLGATLEFIKLPCDVSGQVLTKSSVARTFTVVETAPWIHPNYRGCLTLEIANVSNTPLLLYPGRLICQLILLSVEKPTSPGKMSGTYLGPVFPEAPRFRDPEEDLGEIGITDVERPDFNRKLPSS
jgi:dCTP deaminase